MAFTFTASTPATGAVAFYEFKERLKSAGWTVPSSSDGTTYNSGGDQITGGGAGANGMANTNAWYRIQDPAGVTEFIVQRGTTNTVWRIKQSPTAKFVTGSPSATQTPAATDQVTYWGGGSDASPTFNAYFASDGGTYRSHVGADGASPYGWWFGTFPNGGGAPNTALVYEPLTGAESTDGHKYVTYIASTQGSGAPFNLGSIATEGWSANSQATFGWVPAVTPTTSTNYTGCALGVANSTSLVPNALPTNPISTKDEVFPIVFARRSALANSGYKGVSTVMKWTGTSRSTGDTLTVSTTRDRIVYGSVSLPWDGTVPTV